MLFSLLLLCSSIPETLSTNRRTDDIPIATVVAHPFKLGKPLVTKEEEINLGTQMFNLHRWYMRMSNDEMDMFGVRVYFELLHHIYQR